MVAGGPGDFNTYMEAIHTSAEGRSPVGRVITYQSYGVPSWVFFAVVVVTNAIFLATQIVINQVRGGYLSVATLEDAFYPGVYWVVATTSVATLLLSGLLVGITVAVMVVRAWLHYAPCRAYGRLLLLQLVPWLYFLVALTA